jgi:hypothetical protein
LLGQHPADHVAADARAVDESSRASVHDYSIFNRGQAQQSLVLALARAHRWSRMLERGEVTSINELAAQQGVDPSLIGRTLRLATLAPDITQAILAGQEPYGLSIRQLTKELPTLWGEQREYYGFATPDHGELLGQ